MPIVVAPSEKPKASMVQAVAALLLLAAVGVILLTGLGVWIKLFWIGWVFAR
jgi:hypothetical protein